MATSGEHASAANNPTETMGNIFTDMVMDQAINDKLSEAQKGITGTHTSGNTYEECKREVFQEEDPDVRPRGGSMDSLEDDIDEEEARIMGEMYGSKIEELRELEKKQSPQGLKGYGDYTEITEQDFLPKVTKNQQVVCHFYHAEFERCKIVDKHLRLIAHEHPETLFITLNADKAPFFVGKLAIKVLPTLVCFFDGKAIDRIVGFEDLGSRDDFPTISLIRRLVKAQIIKPRNKKEKIPTIIGNKNEEEDEDEDSDVEWDM